MDIEEQNSASSGTAEQKALHNDIVLEVIFKHVCRSESHRCRFSKDVQHVRLVCKTWCESMTRIVRSAMPAITLASPRHAAPLPPFDATAVDMKEFLDLMKNSILPPVESYIIMSYKFMTEDPRLITDFMEICGPTAVKIQFQVDYEEDDNDDGDLGNFGIEDWVENRSVAWERLKTLHIEVVEESHELKKSASAFFHLIKTVLAVAPNLEAFQFLWHGSATLPNYEVEILKFLPATLKSLKLSEHCLDKSDLETFSKKGLQLKRLGLILNTFGGRSYRSESMQLLQMQSETVEELSIGVSALSLQEFPLMKEVVQLKLRTDQDGVQPQRTLNAPISDTFPKLKVLDLSQIRVHENVELLFSHRKVAPLVTELLLPMRELSRDLVGNLPFPFVRQAAGICPNLTKLHLYISRNNSPDEALRDIFTFLPDLQELTVKGNISYMPSANKYDPVDMLLSGISKQDYISIVHRPRFSKESLNGFDRQPSILSLTKLKILVLDAFDYGPKVDIKLTKFSAHFTFSQLPHLEELHLRGFHVTGEFTQVMRTRKLKILDICSTENRY